MKGGENNGGLIETLKNFIAQGNQAMFETVLQEVKLNKSDIIELDIAIQESGVGYKDEFRTTLYTNARINGSSIEEHLGAEWLSGDLNADQKKEAIKLIKAGRLDANAMLGELKDYPGINPDAVGFINEITKVKPVKDLAADIKELCLKQAIQNNSPALINALGKDVVGASKNTILEYALKTPNVNAKTIQALIFNGANSTGVIPGKALENNPNRDSIVAVLAMDKALKKGFDDLKADVQKSIEHLQKTHMTNTDLAEVVTIKLNSAIPAILKYNAALTKKDSPELQEFKEALVLTAWQEFKAWIVGMIYGEQAQDQSRMDVMTKNLDELFKDKVFNEVKATGVSADKEAPKEGFVNKLYEQATKVTGPAR